MKMKKPLKPRFSISLPAPQMAYIQAIAERRGISFAEVVRWIIDKHYEADGGK